MIEEYIMFLIGICDDERGTCSELENLLYEYGECHKIQMEISIWYTGEGLCDFLKKGGMLDILYLDVELISTNGIKVGKFMREELENMETSIIYISSCSNYAMSLFRVQPLDFLIKPIKALQIDDVMDRAMKQHKRKNQLFEYYSQGNYFKIPYKDIIYFYSDNKKINIVIKESKTQIQFNGKLREIAKDVPNNFLLVHQSYLINSDFVVKYSYEKIKMYNNDELNISRPYRKKVREQIMHHEWENIK